MNDFFGTRICPFAFSSGSEKHEMDLVLYLLVEFYTFYLSYVFENEPALLQKKLTFLLF